MSEMAKTENTNEFNNNETDDRAGSCSIMVNGSGTPEQIGTGLTQPSSRSVRGALRKVRDAHGADTEVGHLCSDIMEASENHEKSTDEVQRRNLAASILRWTDDLDANLKKISH
jgi:hypothetical protein